MNTPSSCSTACMEKATPGNRLIQRKSIRPHRQPDGLRRELFHRTPVGRPLPRTILHREVRSGASEAQRTGDDWRDLVEAAKVWARGGGRAKYDAARPIPP
jgi:hypothetical protein